MIVLLAQQCRRQVWKVSLEPTSQGLQRGCTPRKLRGSWIEKTVAASPGFASKATSSSARIVTSVASSISSMHTSRQLCAALPAPVQVLQTSQLTKAREDSLGPARLRRHIDCFPCFSHFDIADHGHTARSGFEFPLRRSNTYTYIATTAQRGVQRKRRDLISDHGGVALLVHLNITSEALMVLRMSYASRVLIGISILRKS